MDQSHQAWQFHELIGDVVTAPHLRAVQLITSLIWCRANIVRRIRFGSSLCFVISPYHDWSVPPLSVVEASPKSPAPRSANKRRNTASFLSLPFMAEYSFLDRDVDTEPDHSNSRPGALSLDEFGIPGKSLCD